MSAPAPAAVIDMPRRLTQPERVEAMRARLLDATVECLVANGYGEFSTNDVVRRAGVSRGALAHHFPTKAELLSAAGERLIQQRAAEFRATFLTLPPPQRTLAEALDLLWSYYQGPTFAALLELIVAARTNRELRGVLADGPEQITEAAFDVFVELFHQVADHPFAEQMVRGALALLGGLALQTIVDGDRHGYHAALLELVKTLGAVVVPADPIGSS
ncbi:MAG: TetR/AcrR family transcriptional regulator [Acidimicrobiales bacterium]